MSALGDRQHIHRNLSGFAMKLELESFSEETLEHLFRFGACRRQRLIRFANDVIPFGLERFRYVKDLPVIHVVGKADNVFQCKSAEGECSPRKLDENATEIRVRYFDRCDFEGLR